MIKRTKQQNGINGFVRLREAAGIADFRRNDSEDPVCSFDVARNDIDEMGVVAAIPKPRTVNPRAAAHVDNRLRGRRKVTQDQFLRANEFEFATAGRKRSSSGLSA